MVLTQPPPVPLGWQVITLSPIEDVRFVLSTSGGIYTYTRANRESGLWRANSSEGGNWSEYSTGHGYGYGSDASDSNY